MSDHPLSGFATIVLDQEDLSMLRAIRSHHGNQNFIQNTGYYPFLDKLCKDAERYFAPTIEGGILPRDEEDKAVERGGESSSRGAQTQLLTPANSSKISSCEDLLRAGNAMARFLRYVSHQEEDEPCHSCGYDAGKGHALLCDIPAGNELASAWDAATAKARP